MQLLPLGPFPAEILTSSPRASSLSLPPSPPDESPRLPLGERSRAPPAAGCSSLGARGGNGRERNSMGRTLVPGLGGFYFFFLAPQLLIDLNNFYLWPSIPRAHQSSENSLLVQGRICSPAICISVLLSFPPGV